MRVSYGRTAYVGSIGSEMLDRIERMMNTIAVGNGIVVIEREEFVSVMDWFLIEDCEYTDDQKKLHEFLAKVETELTGEYDQVVFVKR